MKRAYLLFTLLIGCIYIHAAIYNVKDFGAKADGKPSILLLSIVRLKQLQKPEEVRFTYQPENMPVILSG